MSKRQGVKRGTDAHNAYIKDVMAQEERREHQHWWRSRQLVLDCVVIAIGELLTEDLGLDQEKVFEMERKFSKRYMDIERNVAYEVTGESDEDVLNKNKVGSLWMSKSKIDRLIKEYVAPEDFVEFDQRYDECREQPYTGKDEIILSLKRLIDKKNDEIVKLKGTIKLLKVKHDGNSR